MTKHFDNEVFYRKVMQLKWEAEKGLITLKEFHKKVKELCND